MKLLWKLIKGTKAKGGKYRVTERIKGAASAKGESKMDQVRKIVKGRKERITRRK